MILTALLARLGWRNRQGTRLTAKERLMGVVQGDREAHQAAQPAPEPPSPQQLIRDGTLKVLEPEPSESVTPYPAVFNLPPGSDGMLRMAGMVWDQYGSLIAVVDLVPSDQFWLDDQRFPVGVWKNVRMAGEVVRVQRPVHSQLWVENPQEGEEPGCWMPLKLHNG